jgi:hypothetical protein
MENKQDEIKSFSEMLESCYTYGGIDRESYNFGRYLQKYEDILGIQLFNEIYQQESQRLKGYKIEPCTYTDSDGLTYNTLIKL